MTDDELLRQSLEALIVCNQHGFLLADYEATVTATIAALRERLARPVVPPEEHIGWCRYVTGHEKATRIVLCDSDAPGAFKVYRSAPTSVPLTDEQITAPRLWTNGGGWTGIRSEACGYRRTTLPAIRCGHGR